MKCPVCGAEATAARGPISISIGQRAVTVEADFNRCPSCGETFYLPGQMDAAQRNAVSAIRAADGLLSPDEVLAIRRHLGLSQAQLEKLLGVGPKTVVRWERGTVCQTGAVDRSLRVLAANPAALPMFFNAAMAGSSAIHAGSTAALAPVTQVQRVMNPAVSIVFTNTTNVVLGGWSSPPTPTEEAPAVADDSDRALAA